MSLPDPTAPRAIVADRQRQTLEIEWADGHVSAYPATLLRWSCPCATCRGEWGRPGRLAGVKELPPMELRLVDVRPVGSYALMPVWESGHDEGIFSFEYLREICPCPSCSVP